MAITVDPIRNMLPGAVARLEAAEAKLAGEARRSREHMESADKALASALADEAAGEEAVALAKLRQTAAACRERAAETSSALATTRARLESARAEQSRKNTAGRWDKAVALTEARNAKIQEMERTAQALVEQFFDVVKATDELAVTLPALVDPDRAVLTHPQLVALLRRELWRNGLDWAWPAPPSYRTNTLSISDEIAGILDTVRQWRDRSLKGE